LTAEREPEVKEGLYYTNEHEWVSLEGDIATVGIDDFAQQQLTDIVFIELPETGKKVAQMEVLASVESVKSVSDVYAPLSGEIVEVNEELREHPEFLNQDPYGKGWIVKLKVDKENAKKELEKLMDAASYKQFLKQQKS
jgi:glycine cleavage system H protein